jgi:hypothetical protein
LEQSSESFLEAGTVFARREQDIRWSGGGVRLIVAILYGTIPKF